MTKASTFPAIPKTCNPQQQKYLRDRLSTASPRYRSWRDRDAEPKEIREARQRIERWEKEQRTAADKRGAVFEKAREAARGAIMFKAPDVALAAVEAYEKLCRESFAG